MTVASSTSRISHTGNGSTTVFPFGLIFFAAADLQVYVGGVLQTLGTNYTLSGTAPYLTGSNVTFTVAPGNGVPVVFIRVVPYTQTLDLVQNDALPPEDLERRLDVNVMMSQQLLEQIGRAFVIPVTDVTGTTVTLPNAASRANQALTFDGSGNVTVGALANAVISSAMQPVASASSVDAARSAMGIVGRNKIINGDLRIWQRGTSGTPALSTTAYTADRVFTYATGASPNVSQFLLGSSGNPTTCAYALYAVGTAGNTAFQIGQKVESLNCLDMIAGRIYTFSAWIYCTTAVTPTWQVYNANATDNWSSNTLVASGTFAAISANTWTRVTGSFTSTNGCLNGVQITFDVGTLTGGKNIYITGIQLEHGSVATPFEHRLLASELALCQRQYWSLGNGVLIQGYANASGANTYQTITLPTLMRTTPTLSTTFVSGINVTSQSVIGLWAGGFQIRIISAGSGDYAGTLLAATAEAEL